MAIVQNLKQGNNSYFFNKQLIKIEENGGYLLTDTETMMGLKPTNCLKSIGEFYSSATKNDLIKNYKDNQFWNFTRAGVQSLLSAEASSIQTVDLSNETSLWSSCIENLKNNKIIQWTEQTGSSNKYHNLFMTNKIFEMKIDTAEQHYGYRRRHRNFNVEDPISLDKNITTNVVGLHRLTIDPIEIQADEIQQIEPYYYRIGSDSRDLYGFFYFLYCNVKIQYKNSNEILRESNKLYCSQANSRSQYMFTYNEGQYNNEGRMKELLFDSYKVGEREFVDNSFDTPSSYNSSEYTRLDLNMSAYNAPSSFLFGFDRNWGFYDDHDYVITIEIYPLIDTIRKYQNNPYSSNLSYQITFDTFFCLRDFYESFGYNQNLTEYFYRMVYDHEDFINLEKGKYYPNGIDENGLRIVYKNNDGILTLADSQDFIYFTQSEIDSIFNPS